MKYLFVWLYKGIFFFNDCKCNLSECDLLLDVLLWVVFMYYIEFLCICKIVIWFMIIVLCVIYFLDEYN